MPNKPMHVPMSFATFYTGCGPEATPSVDELFLLYSKGLENGPGINRDGMGEPWMENQYHPGGRVTHPVEQRRGSWLIDDGYAKQLEISAIKSDSTISQPQQTEWISELDNTPNYRDEFKKVHKGYDIVGMQGCGNLTMNLWFVGFLNSNFTHNKPTFLHLFEEQSVNKAKTYSCLVKWKAQSPRFYSIIDLKFSLTARRIYQAQNDEDVTKRVEFAVFGQEVVKDGAIVDFGTIVREFADIRHLYKLPNINPNTNFDPTKVFDYKRPRNLFQDRREHDVWFGERQMTREEYIDLLIHALTEPVVLDPHFDGMGVSWDLLEACLAREGYWETPHRAIPPRSRGSWRRYGERGLQIFLQRNVYAYTMLGLTPEGNIVASAAGGRAGRIGQTLEAMAQNMIGAGCSQVLLIDEGNDVFQWADGEYQVPPLRGRIRAAFVFACRSQEG